MMLSIVAGAAYGFLILALYRSVDQLHRPRGKAVVHSQVTFGEVQCHHGWESPCPQGTRSARQGHGGHPTRVLTRGMDMGVDDGCRSSQLLSAARTPRTYT